MSGYRNTGLTEEQWEDREILRAAAEVVARRWPYRTATVELINKLADRTESGDGE